MKSHPGARRLQYSPAVAVVVVGILFLGTLATRAQQPAAAATVAVAGDVTMPLTLSLSDIKAMTRTTITVSENNREVKYEGVLVADVLKRAGVPLGRELAGPALATYVVASAKDGYQVVFSLAELDPAFTSNDIIIADTIDGKPLADLQGPLRLVVPHDKRGARWTRALQKLDVVRLRK